MCYACRHCGECDKLGLGEDLASMVCIPCFKCGAAVDRLTGVCTECGDQAFIPVGVRNPSDMSQARLESLSQPVS